MHKPKGKKKLGFHNAQVAATKHLDRAFEICKSNLLL
jgi:hypothetical protein